MIFRELTYSGIVIRIVCAVVIGGIIGIERSVKNRPAGLRTYMLVCVGSCLIMMTNQYIYQTTGTGDPMRLGAQVVSGIGFLGAGTIIVTRHSQIKGLTTAAALWAAAGVGLALGIGFYEAAVTAALAIYCTLTILHTLERKVNRKTRVLEVYIEIRSDVSLRTIIDSLRGLDLAIEDLQPERDASSDEDVRAFILTLKSSTRRDNLLLMEQMKDIEGIVYIETL